MTAFGLDLGGTNLKGVAVDTEGSVLASDQRPADTRRASDAELSAVVAECLANLRETIGEDAPLGVCLPGFEDRETGLLRGANNVAAMKETPLIAWFEEACGVRPRFLNDATAAAWGEAWTGAAQGLDDFLLCTLGTGVGGGAVVGGRLLVGAQRQGAEFGHQVVDPAGPICPCGRRGCVEAYASARALQRDTGFDPETLADRARSGDADAAAAWSRAGHALGLGFSQAARLLDVDTLVVGGGMAPALDLLEPALRRVTDERIPCAVTVAPAALVPWSGAVGAARWAAERAQPTD